LIYSLLQEKSAQEAVDFAGAYSALAHTFPGDFNWATVEETEKAMQSGSVRINR
jgi:sugar/nucleoside kinase (ribokinase family)